MQFQLVPSRTWFLSRDDLYLKPAIGVSGKAVCFKDSMIGVDSYFVLEEEVTPVPFMFAYYENGSLKFKHFTNEGVPVQRVEESVPFGNLPVGTYFSHDSSIMTGRDIFLKVGNEIRGSMGISKRFVEEVQVGSTTASLTVYSTNPQDLVYVCSPPR